MLQHCAQLPALLIDRLPSGLLHMLHTLTLFVVLAVAAGPAVGKDACIALDWGKCVCSERVKKKTLIAVWAKEQQKATT
jgi:hypothetical protein